MTESLTVRPASPAELPGLRAMIDEAGLPLAGFDGSRVTLVAEEAGRPVGVAALERHADDAGAAYLLRSVAVRPAARGRGVGTALTAAALRFVDDEGAPVGLLTETAAGWFPRFGFLPVDRADLPAPLAASEELRGACAVSAKAFLRSPRRA